MSLREESKDFFYRFLFTSLIAVMVFLEIYKTYDPELIEKKNIIYLFLISLSFNVLLVLYHKIHAYIFPAIILVAAALVFLMDSEDLDLFFESAVFSLILISAGSFTVFLITDSFSIMNLIIAVGILAYMIVLLVCGIEIHPGSCAIGVFYIFSFMVRFQRNRLKDPDRKRLRNYLTFLMPFLLLILLLVFIIPKPEDPISWDWAKTIYNNTVEKLNELFHNISLGLGFSEGADSFEVDFSNNSSMTYDNDSAGGIEVLEITPKDHIFSNIYLKGDFFNVFTDSVWKKTAASDEDYSAIDTFETYYGLVSFNRDHIYNFMRKAHIDIRYLNFTSDLFFAPAKTVTSDFESRSDLVHVKNEQLFFNEIKTYGMKYGLDFLQLNYGSRSIDDFLNNTFFEDDPEAFEITRDVYLRTLFNGLTLNDLKKYREYIKEYYTSTPEIRDSVKKWIDDIIKGKETDYEKLKAVEHTLSMMEYTLDTGNLPDYVKSEGDFLNYFIIEKQAGYCVHYATAFCLIARYLGYASRIIQGYAAPVALNEPNVILNGYGHSWPEVYFEGKGWIAFEPTPGMGKDRYSGWMDSYDIYDLEDTSVYTEDHEGDHPPASPLDPEYEEEHREGRISMILIIAIPAIVLLSLILLIIFSLVLNKRYKKKLNDSELYHYEFTELLIILKELKIVRQDNMTIEEFSLMYLAAIQKASKDLNLKDDAGILNETGFFETYEGILYGKSVISKDQLSKLYEIKKALWGLLKKYYKKTYLFHRLHINILSSFR